MSETLPQSLQAETEKESIFQTKILPLIWATATSLMLISSPAYAWAKPPVIPIKGKEFLKEYKQHPERFPPDHWYKSYECKDILEYKKIRRHRVTIKHSLNSAHCYITWDLDIPPKWKFEFGKDLESLMEFVKSNGNTLTIKLNWVYFEVNNYSSDEMVKIIAKALNDLANNKSVNLVLNNTKKEASRIVNCKGKSNRNNPNTTPEIVCKLENGKYTKIPTGYKNTRNNFAKWYFFVEKYRWDIWDTLHIDPKHPRTNHRTK